MNENKLNALKLEIEILAIKIREITREWKYWEFTIVLLMLEIRKLQGHLMHKIKDCY